MAKLKAQAEGTREDRLAGQVYSDGAPLDRVQYLECKLILKPDRFTSAKVFLDYGKMVEKAADAFGLEFSRKGIELKPDVREVLFLDTQDFRLYNNAFILRRRIKYEDGFPAGDPEIVFKFRHPELLTAANLDVRPNIGPKADYRIKFKAEALPLKDRPGGYRLLYSHNVQFGLGELPEGDRTAMTNLARIFPALGALSTTPGEHVALVNQTIVEEVLQDLGVIHFGKGIKAKANIAIWRERGTHRPMCGEFAFQAKFERMNAVHDKVLARAKAFFLTLQDASLDWLSLGTTKTGLVYRLKGNPPQAHE